MLRTRDKGYAVGRGALLIINQGTFTSPDLTCREPGTSKDRDSLELVFRSLGYGVHIANDCNKDAFEGHLENAVDLIGDGVGPFVLAFLSHGDSGDLLYFADGTHMSRFEIRRTLQRHRTLHGRPKIIIVQACRGPEHLVALKDGSTVIMKEGEDFSPDSAVVDPMADTIVMWSCMEERVAYLHRDIGSMFIILTCDEILKNMVLAKRPPPSGEKHITDLSMSVNKSMENYVTRCHGFRMLTSPENISSLKKPLFLGPPVNKDKFRRAVERIDGLKLELDQVGAQDADQVQVVPNLQPDDDHKDDEEDENDDDEDRLALATGGIPAGAAGQSASSGERGCGCKPTGCGKSCGCVKKGVLCVANCHGGRGGNLCKNHRTPSPIRPSPATDVKVKFERAQSSKGSKEKSTATNPEQVERGSSDEETDDEESVVCGCKSGCGTKRCSCQKAELDCGSRCHGGSPCENLPKKEGEHEAKGPKQKSNKLATGNVNVSETACPTGGEGSRCGLGATEQAVCAIRSATAGRAGSNCANRIKASGADKIVKCKCKTGCSPNSRCSCRKADVLCGPNCHPGEQCEN